MTIEDVTDEPRAFTVDEVLGAAEPDDPRVPPHLTRFVATPGDGVVVEPNPDETIHAAINNVARAYDQCLADIEQLVQERLWINALIKTRRRQLAKLHRMQRIVAEHDPDDD